MPKPFPENSKNAQQVNGVRRNLMKKKIIYVLCILGVFLALLGLKKRNDTMYSSGVYHLNRSGIVESIGKNIIVVRLDKLNEQDEDFKNVNTLQLDCRNCSYELENLKEGTKIIFYYFPYNADVRPLKVENIYVINEKESNIDLTEKAGQLFNSYRDKTDESNPDYDFVKNYISAEYTIYDKIINLCDLMCSDKIMTVDKRLIDILIRKGAYSNTQYHIKETYKLKEYFDTLLGFNLYNLFPEIKDNL